MNIQAPTARPLWAKAEGIEAMSLNLLGSDQHAQPHRATL